MGMTALPPLTLDLLSRALTAEPPAASSDYDLNPEVRAGLPPSRRLSPAAVLIPVVARAQGLGVLLTRRAARLKNHPGQIAFPGGRMDPTDPSPWHAALREAEEEIGLSPALVSPLGILDRHETVTRFDVEPHVGVIAPGFTVRPAEAEVAEVFEVPLDYVLRPENFQTHSRLWHGRPRHYFAVPYGPYYIWGATARILKGLSDRLGTLA